MFIGPACNCRWKGGVEAVITIADDCTSLTTLIANQCHSQSFKLPFTLPHCTLAGTQWCAPVIFRQVRVGTGLAGVMGTAS